MSSSFNPIRKTTTARALSHASRPVINALESRRLLAVAALGGEFLVNQTTNDFQQNGKVAMDADGDFVVTWTSVGTPSGILARRFDADGSPLGDEFVVATVSTSPDIAMEDNGDFVIVWTQSTDVFARRYSADGTALAAAFRANSTQAGDQSQPSVAMDANGDFVVAWQDDSDGSGTGVFARRFNNAGTATTNDVPLAQNLSGNQTLPDVACNPTLTSFVATWTGVTDGSETSVQVRVFDGAGVATTNEFRANQFTDLDQNVPEIAMDDDGDFVVAWTSQFQHGSSNGYDVFARRFNAAGAAQGNEFPVNTNIILNQGLDDVAMNEVGDFVISFTSGSSGQRLRGFRANGTAEGNDVTVASGRDGGLAFRGTRVVVAYTDSAPGGNLDEVLGQRYVLDYTNPVAPSVPNLLPQSDSGVSNSDDITNDTTPIFLVTGEDNGTVELLVDGVVAATDFAGNGIHTVAIPASFNLQDGVRQIRARQRDEAGNLSPTSAALPVTIDTVAPPAPSTPDLVEVSDTGFSDADDITRDNTPQLAGSAENNATVEIIEGTTVLGSVVASGGIWGLTITPALPDGVHVLRSRATDVAGNAGVSSNALSITIDTVAPAAPSVPDLNTASDTGVSNTDNITRDNTPQFDGTVEPNAIARVTIDILFTFTDLTTPTGTYSVVTTALADGAHTARAAAEDLAGNLSPVSVPLGFQIDTVAPAAPFVAPDLITASDSGLSNSDNITNDSTPTFTGNSGGNPVIRLVEGIVLFGSDTTAGATYLITTGTMGDGTYNLAAIFEDTAGNRSPAGPTLPVTIDTEAPSVLTTPDFNFQTAPHNLAYRFSENVGPTLAPADFTVEQTAGGIGTFATAVSYNPATNVGTVRFTGVPQGVLPDGRFRSTLAAAGVTDVAGNALAADSVFNFLFLRGDANNDGRVNLNDFNILAANFGQSNRNFAQGDFDYSGNVNLNDFNILAARFGATVAPDAGAATPGLPSRQRERLLDELR